MVSRFVPNWRHRTSVGWLAGIVVVLALLPLGGTATTTADELADGDDPPFEVVHQLGGLVEAFVADGDYLYLGIGSRLVVLDANTVSGVPEGGGTYVSLPHTIVDAAVPEPGTVAVLAGDVIFLVDVSDPSDPRIDSSYEQEERLAAIEAYRGTCYLLAEQSIVHIDVSDPANMSEIARTPLPTRIGFSTRLVAGDGVLFVGGGQDAVLAFDVSEPQEPRLLGGIEEDIETRTLAVAGRRLYVHDASDRLDASGNRVVGVIVYVLDVLENGQLVHHGFVTLYEPRPVLPKFHFTDMAADGTHLFVSGAAGDSGVGTLSRAIRSFDVTDPSHPVEVSRVSYPGLGSTVAMLATGGKVYVAANDAIQLPDYRYQSPGIGATDVTDPGAIEWNGYWQLDDLGSVSFVGAHSSHVAIGENHSSLIHIYDGVYEAGKGRSGYINSKPTAKTLRTTGHRTYTLGSSELTVYDTRASERPELLATAPVTTRRTSLAIEEPNVYSVVGCNNPFSPGGETHCTLVVLEVIDGEGATTIEELAQVPVGQIIRDIAVSKGYAYIAAREGESQSREQLAVFDVRDPAQPTHVLTQDLGEGVWAKRTAVRDDVAYVATLTFAEDGEVIATGLTVLDVTHPPDISIVSSLEITTNQLEAGQWRDRNGHVALTGDYALYSSDEPVVHVVDVSDPENPMEVQRIDVPAVVSDLDAAAGQVYVVTNDGGMLVLQATGRVRPPGESEPALFLPMVIAHGGQP